MPATYEPIATSTLGAAAANITFSGITSTYTDLKLVFNGLSVSSGVSPYIRFNSDSGTNYSITYIDGNGTSPTSGRQTSQATLKMGELSSTSTTIPIFFTCDVFSYAGSTNKTVVYSCQNDKNGSGVVEYGVGLWRNTSAITSILVAFTSGNIASGSTATLYGIKAA